MKRLSLLLVFVLLLGVVSCNKTTTTPEKTLKYYAEMSFDPLSKVEDLFEKVDEYNIDNDFFVLAPQYEKRASVFYADYPNIEKLYLKESFFVCNEEKYGKQITDWGQYGGIAYNFSIAITIDTSYTFSSNSVRFDYISVERGKSKGSVYKVNLYCNNDCFASVQWTGFGFANENAERNCIESYLTENIMPQSKIKDWYLTEYVPSNLSLEIGEKPVGEKAYYCNHRHDAASGHGYAFSELFATFFEGEISIFFPMFSNYCIYGVDAYVESSNSFYEDGYSHGYPWSEPVCEEPYICQLLIIPIPETLCDLSESSAFSSMGVNAVIIPYKVDFEKGVTFEWIDCYTANLYCGDFCFATVFYSVSEELSDGDKAICCEYLENYLIMNLLVIDAKTWQMP